jgi:arylsulfatase A-like enzyme
LKNQYIILLCFYCCLYSCKGQESPAIRSTPNIVLIVADDMGFSDLGCFGSEILTPNIDGLASDGRIFSSFYTAATCSPTRAMLLSGTDNHIAGLGNMAERSINIPEQRGKPGYEGYLNNRVVSVAQLLQDAGYHTYMAGKWHLGLTADQSPASKGFERSFALLDAYSNHFNPYKENSFWEDDGFATYPEGKYSTNLYTDKLIGYLNEGRKDDKPFFLYAAYTSPHWPLQAPKEDINKYQGKYDVGYDTLRVRRFNGLKKSGIINSDVVLPKLPELKGKLYTITDEKLKRWNSLNENQRRLQARKMEIYAAMVDNLDQNVGRLIEHLKKIGEYDNTLFVFFSDNGPDPMDELSTPDEQNPFPYMGTANSFVAYGQSWAHASSAVNRLYKGYSAEGGIHTPMIIKLPKEQGKKQIVNAFTTVMDLAPTFLEIAQVKYPTTYKGRALAPYKGTSLLPFLENKKNNVHDDNYVMGWELFGRAAIRKGKWKISLIEPPFGKNDFEMFDLEADPTESHDLSKEFPDKYREMLSLWNTYVKENGVIMRGQ